MIELTKKQLRALPKYVKLIGASGSALRLIGERKSFGYNENNAEYFRDGGGWSVDFKIDEDNRLFTICDGYERLHNLELIPITYHEWRKDNGEYVDKNTKAHKF